MQENMAIINLFYSLFISWSAGTSLYVLRLYGEAGG